MQERKSLTGMVSQTKGAGLSERNSYGITFKQLYVQYK